MTVPLQSLTRLRKNPLSNLLLQGHVSALAAPNVSKDTKQSTCQYQMTYKETISFKVVLAL